MNKGRMNPNLNGEIVDINAAIKDATIRPNRPDGRKEIIAGPAKIITNYLYLEMLVEGSIFGYTTIDARAIRIQGQGLTA